MYKLYSINDEQYVRSGTYIELMNYVIQVVADKIYDELEFPASIDPHSGIDPMQQSIYQNIQRKEDQDILDENGYQMEAK